MQSGTGTSLSQKIIRSVSWLAVGQIAQRLSRLVITAVLARLLIPEDFGLIGLVTIAVGLVSTIGSLGITSALVQRAELTEEHLCTAFWLSIAIGLLLTICGISLAEPIASIYMEPRVTPLLIAMMAIIAINNLAQVSEALLQRRLAFRQLAIIDWMSSALSGVIGIIMALAGFGVWALVAQAVGLSVLSAGARIIVAKWKPKLVFAATSARQIFSFSLSVLGATVVNFGMGNIDNLLIGRYLGVEALGYYALAYNLIMLPSMSIAALVARVMFPVLSSLQNDLSRLRRGYLRMLHVVATIAFPIMIGMGATAPLLISTIYGENWIPAVELLQILSVVGLFEAIRTSGVVFYALGRPNLILMWVIVSLGVMFTGFSIALTWGLTGMAWCYVAMSPVLYLVPHILANHLINLPLRRFLLAISPALIAGLVMGASVVFFQQALHLFSADWANLSILVALGAIVYTLSLAIIGVLSSRRPRSLINWVTGQYLTLSEK